MQWGQPGRGECTRALTDYRNPGDMELPRRPKTNPRRSARRSRGGRPVLSVLSQNLREKPVEQLDHRRPVNALPTLDPAQRRRRYTYHPGTLPDVQPTLPTPCHQDLANPAHRPFSPNYHFAKNPGGPIIPHYQFDNPPQPIIKMRKRARSLLHDPARYHSLSGSPAKHPSRPRQQFIRRGWLRHPITETTKDHYDMIGEGRGQEFSWDERGTRDSRTQVILGGGVGSAAARVAGCGGRAGPVAGAAGAGAAGPWPAAMRPCRTARPPCQYQTFV